MEWISCYHHNEEVLKVCIKYTIPDNAEVECS